MDVFGLKSLIIEVLPKVLISSGLTLLLYPSVLRLPFQTPSDFLSRRGRP